MTFTIFEHFDNIESVRKKNGVEYYKTPIYLLQLNRDIIDVLYCLTLIFVTRIAKPCVR